MNRKWIIIAITLIAVGAITGGYFFFRGKLQPTAPPVNAIPNDAVVIVETESLEELVDALSSGKNQAWKEISEIKEFYALKSQVAFLDSVFNNDKDLSKLLKNRQITISLHPTGKNKYNFLYILGTENTGIYEEMQDWASENIEKKYDVKQREDKGVTYYEGELEKTSYYKKFTYTFHEGLFIFSFSSLLVEKSVNALVDGTSPLKDPVFNKVYDAKGKNVPASIFVNFSKSGEMLSGSFNNEKTSLALSIGNIADWSLSDLKIKDDLIILYGFSAASDSAASYLNVYKNQQPVGFQMDEILPMSTSFFVNLGIEKPGVFQTEYKKYLKEKNKLQQYNKLVSEYKASYGIDPEELFRSFMGNEMALVKTGIKGLKTEESTFIIFKTGSGDFTKDRLMELLKAYAESENKETGSLIHEYNLDKDKKFNIYSFPFPDLIKTLFGDLFGEIQPEYFTIYKNYLIFARTKEAASAIIYANVLQKVLSLDLDFQEFKQNLSSASSIFVWADLSASRDILSEYLKPEITEAMTDANSHINKFQGVAIQFVPSGDYVYNNIFLQYNPKVYREDPKTVWESRLDTCVAIKPKFVINHDTDEKEVFVQDVNNTIYLLNSTGRVLWRKNIKERIMSDVYQIDYYKNGKLQLMFNTKNKIYLLDRLGNNVEKFPVELRGPASNGISVFDYENNRDYRLFVACNNGAVYAMDKDGRILKGWEFEETEHPVKTPVQHFRIEDKDYIVFSDSLKTYILDRKGNVRVNVEEYFPASANNKFCLDKDPKTKKYRMVSTTVSGKPVFVYFDGKVEIKELKELSEHHYFDLNDIDGDGYNDFIFLDGNKLMVYNYELLPMFTKEFETNIPYPPIFFVFPDNSRRLGIVEPEKSLIYLIEETGQLYEGFPLKGYTLFSIGNMNNEQGIFNLLVGSKNNFLYNYTVH